MFDPAKHKRSAPYGLARPVTPYRYSYAYSSRQPRQRQPGRVAQPSARHRSLALAGVCLLAVIVVGGGMHVAQARGHDGPETKNQATAPAKPQFTPAAVTDPTMAQELNGIIEQYSYLQVGVTLVSVADGKIATYGVSDPYVAGSVDKLLTAAAYLYQVDHGQATLTQRLADGKSAQTALQQMIVQSDNTAWTNLNNYLTHAQLEAYASSLGLSSYDADRNTISPEDVAQLLYKLYDGKLLKAPSRSLLLSYMSQSNYREYIMTAVPKNVTAYHKVGVLEDRVNDVAIIDNGKTAYVLVIFSKATAGGYDFGDGQQMFHALTAATTKHLL